ncbi:hypothetical protein DBR44_09595 [Aquitalea sp. FJL05]|uniref:hypothetical protein n=1 Tax=Aquitalea sp. FJL05 TaxID=2153366 RepID=UPI000F5B67DF|nr:hypothetical protein [Aquitalea sp. FJL05]RQO73159.1 hypothetical protein DBR44_09595 [Aquitalea sp. FJL05]
MLKAGDTFSIVTATGVGYFQYVKKMPPLGSLIRVIPKIYAKSDIFSADFLEVNTNFFVFFPVADSLKKGLIEKIGNFPIPQHAKTPIFRTGIVNPATKKVDVWWLWDGIREWKIGELSDEQRRLPIRGVWNDTLLKERIDEGWLPEFDLR